MAALQAKQMSALKASAVARPGFSRQSRVAVSAMFAKTKAKATSKVAYVCLDCGYIYDGATPFEDLKSYACPVCAAPKRRFKELRGNNLRGNDSKSMQTRKQKLRDQIAADGGDADEGQNEFLIGSVGVIVATLGLLAYFNLSQ